jgi:hypothetical protein
MEIPNLDNGFAVQALLQMECDVCVFYMHYVAFDFKFSGTVAQLADTLNEINRLQNMWGYMHRN